VEQFILNILSGYGLAGVVILALGWTVLQQHKAANKVNEERLKERAQDISILVKALDNNTQSTKDNAHAIAERNDVTEDLVKSFERQSLIFELLTAKLEMHVKGNAEATADFKLTINAIAEASRVNTGILREIRDRHDNEPIPRRRS